MYFEFVMVGARRFIVNCSPDTPPSEILRRALEQAERQENQERRDLVRELGYQR